MTPIQVQKKHTYTGHNDCLYTLERLDEFCFFSAGGDGMVVRWDLRDPDNGDLMVKVPSSVYALSFYSASGILVVGQNFSGIHLIEVSTKKEIGSLALTSSQIFDIQTSEKGIYVTTGDGELILVNWELQVLNKQKLTDKSGRTITIHPERDELAVGYSDNFIRLFDASTLEFQLGFEAHSISVFTLKYHPGLPVLISGSRDAKLKFWDIDNNYQLLETVAAHMYAINHIEFSPDAQHFVSCSMDKSIKVWDANQFKLLKVIDKARHAGHATSVNKLLWMNHQNQLLSCSDDRTISQWDINFASEL